MTDDVSRILLIEDDDALRSALETGLRKSGYVVRGLPDGKYALSQFEAFSPDLVITDIIMPEKEGIGLIVQLRNLSPSTPIIAISGGGMLGPQEVLGYASAFQVERTLAKPFSISDLTTAVAQVLAKAAS